MTKPRLTDERLCELIKWAGLELGWEVPLMIDIRKALQEYLDLRTKLMEG